MMTSLSLLARLVWVSLRLCREADANWTNPSQIDRTTPLGPQFRATFALKVYVSGER